MGKGVDMLEIDFHSVLPLGILKRVADVLLLINSNEVQLLGLLPYPEIEHPQYLMEQLICGLSPVDLFHSKIEFYIITN